MGSHRDIGVYTGVYKKHIDLGLGFKLRVQMIASNSQAQATPEP